MRVQKAWSQMVSLRWVIWRFTHKRWHYFQLTHQFTLLCLCPDSRPTGTQWWTALMKWNWRKIYSEEFMLMVLRSLLLFSRERFSLVSRVSKMFFYSHCVALNTISLFSISVIFHLYVLTAQCRCQFFFLWKMFIGHDVIAQAQSGTGKTATFVISILQRIDTNLKETQALILAPTRELAQQVTSLINISLINLKNLSVSFNVKCKKSVIK